MDCDSDHRFDYIVVGVGTAGALIVRALADSGQSVLGLERGINHTGDPVVEGGIGAIFPPTGNASKISYDTKYSVSKAVPDEKNAIILGQLVFGEIFTAGIGGGGSSAHNYLLAVRGTPGFWDSIGAASGRPDIWSYFPNLPTIKAVETYTGLSQKPQERGTNGKIQVTQVGGDINASPAVPFANGLSAVTGGTPLLLDYNVSGADVVISNNQFTIFPTLPLGSGGRSYAINAFLPPDIMKFDGMSKNFCKYPFEVIFEANVTKILFDGKKAIGVVFLDKDKKLKRAFAKKEVILCGGSPYSAQLLQLSGIGDKAMLKGLGIESVYNNPNVGKGLQTQYGVSVAITGFLPAGFIAFTGAAPYFPDTGRRLQWNVAPFSGLDPGQAALLKPNGPFFGAVVWNMKPRSVGSAFITQNSPFIQPNILLNLYTDGTQADPLSDLSASIATYKLARDWAHAIGQTMIWPPESHFTTGNDDQLAFDAISQVATNTTSHYINTTGMSTSKDTGVIDAKLRVFGVENLRVIDNGSLPSIPDGNTVIPAYIVGATGARLLGGKIPHD